MATDTLDIVYRLTEIAGFLVAIITIIIGTGKILYRMGAMAERFETIGKQQAIEIMDLKESVKELVKVTGRLERIEERQLSEGKRIDGLEARINRYINGLHEANR